MMKKVLSFAALLLAAGVIAGGFGMYVYPARPTVVWTLLFVCWACYRLHLRAVCLFGGLKHGESHH